ncbi:hypothetical protein E3E22_07135 [Thermococcus sp. MV5]|uniref:hypothetical protein n=1 Tax=Thermococcus sp. MV5 TaxID=1638272 RepID=UPI0014395F1F|nr:hypothetical protein [Thermococcus sp. MV5]NJE26394.1 hypothetical protein [Thermococcus sp. MV5]
MWRKALALGLVLMAIGVIVDGAIEEAKWGAYRYLKYRHKYEKCLEKSHDKCKIYEEKGETGLGAATIGGILTGAGGLLVGKEIMLLGIVSASTLGWGIVVIGVALAA